MPGIGLKARLAAGYAVLLALAFLLTGGITFGIVTRCLDDQMRQVMLGMAAFQRNWPASYPPFAFATSNSTAAIFYLTRDGSLLYRSVQALPPIAHGNAAIARLGPAHTREFVDLETPSGPRRVLLAWMDPPYSEARLIEVVMSLAPLREILHRILVWVSVVSALATLGSVPLGLLLARRALQPLSSVIETASALGDEASLDRRAPAPDVLDEIGTLADVFNRMLERIQAAFRRQRQFTEDASHELRTPLTVLRGEVELALRRERSPDEYRCTLRGVLEEVDRLQDLANDLLTLTRLDGLNETDRSQQATDLARVLCEVVERLTPPGIAWRVTAPDGPVLVRGTSEAWERLVANLASNARLHAPGAPAAFVLSRRGTDVLLVVEDDGPGLPAGDAQRLFDRFARGDGARGLPGAGLGLAIVRRIVEDAGGRIGASNRVEGGARFELVVPAAERTVGGYDDRTGITTL